MRWQDNPQIRAKYNCSRWKKVRHQKLLLNPLCERCLKNGIYKATDIIHHKEEVNDSNYLDESIMYNINNLESLCIDCHNKEHFKEEAEYIFDEEGNVIKK